MEGMTGMNVIRPSVSVILPTYNRSSLLKESIGSVLAQTYSDFELLVVDDGSTDDTREAVAAIDDKRIRYIGLTKNRGQAAARNIGVKEAKASLVASQDSDDIWLPEKLDMQMSTLRESSARTGVVYTAYERICGNRSEVLPSRRIVPKTGDVHARLLRGNFITTQTTLIRRECFEKVGSFDEGQRSMDDWDLFIRLSKDYHFAFVDKLLVKYRVLSDSVSVDMDRFVCSYERILGRHKAEIPDNSDLLAWHYAVIGGHLCRNGDLRRGRAYLGKALSIRPMRPRYAAALVLSLFGPRACTLLHRLKR
jgi:glycosyltransferase involved in cell wall biosynthesis